MAPEDRAADQREDEQERQQIVTVPGMPCAAGSASGAGSGSPSITRMHAVDAGVDAAVEIAPLERRGDGPRR